MSKPYNQISGYEDETLELGEDGFYELLETNVAVPVEICNYDLSECRPMKAIIQNRLQDTKLQSLSRTMLTPIGTCEAGMYVKYKERYWLITGLVDDNGVYEKSILSLCNHLLSWVNEKGEIIQRWSNIVSASQYNNGESNMLQLYFVRSDQLLILMPNDNESIFVTHGKRFVIDKRCSVYEKSFASDTVKDTSKEIITYQVTRKDSVLYDYNDSGCMQFLMTQDEQRVSDGYYVVDGKGYWLCDSPIMDKNTLLSCSIECDDNVIYNGLEAGIFKAVFYNKSGNEDTTIIPTWDIKCDFIDKLNVTYDENYISIFVNDSKLINKSFELSLNANGYDKVSVEIYIRGLI